MPCPDSDFALLLIVTRYCVIAIIEVCAEDQTATGVPLNDELLSVRSRENTAQATVNQFRALEIIDSRLGTLSPRKTPFQAAAKDASRD